MNLAITLGAIYIIVMPIILRLAALMHKKLLIDKRAQKMKGNRAALSNLPKPLWPKWMELLSFVIKDKRDMSIGKGKKDKGGEPTSSKMQNRQAFLLFLTAGLAIVLIGAFITNWWVVGIGYVTFFIAIGWGMNSAKDVIETRKKVYARMFSIAKLKLGQSAEHENSPQAVIKVLEWNDYVRPQRVEFSVPDAFGAEGEEGFLRQFNQIFGTITTWVPNNDPETGKPGWDYEEGKVTIYAVPPLPTMAPWDARYVLTPGIAWSFFPLALGVENGIALSNPETGVMENVLGFDLSGIAAGEGKKHGLEVSPTITTSPMCLTGDTLIWLSDDSLMSIKDIVENGRTASVPAINEHGEIVHEILSNAVLTKRNADVYEVKIDGYGSVKATEDHPFLTKEKVYVNLIDLSEGQELFSTDNRTYKVENIKYIGREDVFNAEVSKVSNFIICSDVDRLSKIVVHNCFIGGGTGGGKSVSLDTLVEVIE